MAFTTVDQLLAAMISNRERKQVNKTSSVAAQAAGSQTSMWNTTGYPATGAIPTAVATCNNTTVGGIPFTNPTTGLTAVIARIALACSAVCGVEIHDRLAHMGGLSGIVTTAQTVNLDITALGATDNIAQRMGASDFSSLQWFLEWYTTTGATAVNATVTYTNQNNTTGNTVVLAIPVSTAGKRMFQIVPNAGDFIQSVQSVTLSATTGTAGNFGVTVSVERTTIALPIANVTNVFDWALLGIPQIYNSSCLSMIVDLGAGTTITALGGSVLIAKG